MFIIRAVFFSYSKNIKSWYGGLKTGSSERTNLKTKYTLKFKTPKIIIADGGHDLNVDKLRSLN